MRCRDADTVVQVARGEEVGAVESVKAASEVGISDTWHLHQGFEKKKSVR